MMVRGISLFVVFVLTCGLVVAQNTNSSTTTERPRTTNTNRAKPTPSAQTEKAPAPAPKQAAKKPAPPAQASSPEAAFNALIEGIRQADVDAVTGVYWNDRRLSLFNYNGSVTKGWEQVRKNRESSYPEIKDVKLDVRDLSVTMLDVNSAVVTCLWTQSQNYKGVPETASGRMTLVFKRFGKEWKAIHLHSSPDTPNPAAIPPSEQRPAPSPSPTP